MQSVPKYQRQRAAGRPDRAYVRIDGRRVYLGKYGSPESRQRYAEVIGGAKHLDPPAERSKVLTPDGGAHRAPPTITQLIVAYLRHAKEYYGDVQRGEYPNMREALRWLRRGAGRKLASEFGPRALKQIRQTMIDAGLARTSINQRINRIRRMFKWAASEELIDVKVWRKLTTVDGLRAGRTKAKEPKKVQPVDGLAIQSTLPHLPPVVADMVEIQRLTGMRSGELVIMRPEDVDRSGEVWLYTPSHHKTEHHGKTRVIAIGPKAQEHLAPFLIRMPDQRCFGYSVVTYARAIRRGCERAGIPRWTPHQLRHSAATEARRVGGLDGAQAMLGHSNANVTQIYAELATEKAAELALRIG